MLDFSISLLGSFQASINEKPISQFRTKSVQALLIYLVCEAQKSHQREALMHLLWPGMPLKSAQANMRQTLYRLRKIVEEVRGSQGETAVPFLITNRQTIQINPDADCFVDVHEFTALIETEPEKAIALYRGDFLADFFLPDSETFEEWANNRREVYRRQVLAAMEQVTAVSIENANYDKAISFAQRQLEIDNLRESSHRQLMEAWARNGRRQDALAHYETMCQLLQDELAIEPESETLTLIEAIRADEFGRTSILQTNDPESSKHNLPQRLTSFVGREKEIATITDLIRQHHLIMLTGVGGIGKTNLSLQVGRRLLDSFLDGVWLVELAPLTDPMLIPQTAVSALGLVDLPNQTALQTLLNYLQEKACLLILDNCEHLIHDAAQFVQTLLQNCPDLKIVASSREPLGIPGEIPFHLPSLSIPDNMQNPTMDNWQQYDAVRLFVERATAVLPDFQVTEDNINSLMQICRRLDGIPLAIELAAARVKMLTLAQIAERLDDRFLLLTGGSRTALPRQQTLRAMIDWSWELLTEAEQLLFQRLSVFAGGMHLEAIEAICADDELSVYDILDVLTELVNKSLVIVQREQGQETRYYLLETIRQYAQERSFIVGDGGLIRHRHLDYFLQLGEQAEQALVGPDQVVWMNRLQRDWPNIRAALNWALETNTVKGLRLLVGLWRLWHVRGSLSEGEDWLVQFLDQSEDIEPALRAKALDIHGFFNIGMFKLKRSRQLIEESLSIYQSLPDQNGMARCLNHLGQVANQLGEHDAAQNFHERSLSIYRNLADEDKLGLADTLAELGFFTGNIRKQYETAVGYVQESLSLYKDLQHLAGIGGNLTNLGILALQQGDYDAAQTWLEESWGYLELLQEKSGKAWLLVPLGFLYSRLGKYDKAQGYLEDGISISKQIGLKYAHYWARILLGYCFLWKGEFRQAQTIFIESQERFKEVNHIIGVIFATEGLAILAVRWQQPERATQLFSWADATRKVIKDPRPPSEQADVDRETEAILQMIDKAAYAAAYTAGQTMTMEQVIAYSLEDKD